MKEIVENALDAFASKIVLIVQEGGLKSLQIIDDGIGIYVYFSF